jgi:hypothetical protein
LILVEDQSASYFLGPVGTSDPSDFIAAKSQRIPSRHHCQDPMSGKTLSRTGICPQSQAGETGTRGCLMMIAPRETIGKAFALLIVWNSLWPKHPKMRAS